MVSAMFVSKYRSYLGVAAGCVGVGLALKYTADNDKSQLNLRDNAISVVEEVLSTPHAKYDFSSAVNESRKILSSKKDLSGTPGVSIAVNVDGKTVWSEGKLLVTCNYECCWVCGMGFVV